MSRYSIRGQLKGVGEAHIVDSESARNALGFATGKSAFTRILVRDNVAGRDLTLAELRAAAKRERRSKLTFGSVLFGLVGFVVGFALVGFLLLGAVYLIGELFNSRIVPRGLGFIAMPIMGGVGGFIIFAGLVTNKDMRERVAKPFLFVGSQFKPGHFINRLCLIFAVLYAIAGHFVLSAMTELEIEWLYSYQFDTVLMYVWAPVAFPLLLPLIIAWARKPPKADKPDV